MVYTLSRVTRNLRRLYPATRESTLVMIMAQKSDIDLKGHPKQAKFFFQIIAISVNKKEKLLRERYKEAIN